MHLPFFPLVNLLREMDREKGKFLELLGTNEGEKLSRMSFLLSLGQRWACTASKFRSLCFGWACYKNPGPSPCQATPSDAVL